MVRKTWIGFWLMGLCSVSGVRAAESLPNVIYVMADDLGIGDVECYGGQRCQIATPNFDRLAREGMKFTDAHVTASVCIPSRIAIMTGRYAWRFRPPKPDGRWAFLLPRIDTGRETLGTLMQRAGYATGYIGKWHLGTLMQTTDGKVQGSENTDFTKPLQVAPPQYGFDTSFILPGSLDMYPYVFIRNQEFVGDVTAQKGWSAFNRIGPAAEDFEDVRVLDTLSTEMETFISQHAQDSKQGKPFFLYFGLTAPHTPISPSEAFEGKSDLGLYGDFVGEADHCLGRVLAALDRHGIAQNTLVIATSDHGACPCAGNIRKATRGQIRLLEDQGHYSAGIHQGYKFSIYEGGLRVPFVVRWPQQVQAGAVCDRLVSTMDLMGTLAELCAVSLENDAGEDSISFLPLLHDASGPGTRESLLLNSTHSLAIRRGKWKLCMCPGSGCSGTHGNQPPAAEAWQAATDRYGKLPKSADDFVSPEFLQLFDLEADPGETRNVAAEHPVVLQELMMIAVKVAIRGRSTPGEQVANEAERFDLFTPLPKSVRAPAPK